MKTLLAYLAFAGILLLCRSAAGQNCGQYYNLQKGGKYELTTYDARDQMTGRVVQEVREVTTSGSKTTAVLRQQVFDKKDKLSTEADYTVECEAGMVRVDMRSLLNSQAAPGTKGPDIDVEVTGDFLELPATLKPGTSLKDGSMTATMRDRKNAAALSTATINVSNRKVEGLETVKTAAGSFECAKVSQDMQMKAGIGSLSIPFNTRTIEWYAPGVGPVRSEIYRKDKLMSYSVLTAKP